MRIFIWQNSISRASSSAFAAPAQYITRMTLGQKSSEILSATFSVITVFPLEDVTFELSGQIGNLRQLSIRHFVRQISFICSVLFFGNMVQKISWEVFFLKKIPSMAREVRDLHWLPECDHCYCRITRKVFRSLKMTTPTFDNSSYNWTELQFFSHTRMYTKARILHSLKELNLKSCRFRHKIQIKLWSRYKTDCRSHPFLQAASRSHR